MTNRRKNILLVIVAAVVLGLGFFRLYYNQMKRERDYVFIKAEAIQTRYGWGYEIMADGKPYIHQEFIPALIGRRGFDSREDAIRVGNRVIDKIKKKQIPPAISIDDLKELGILKAADSASIQH